MSQDTILKLPIPSPILFPLFSPLQIFSGQPKHLIPCLLGEPKSEINQGQNKKHLAMVKLLKHQKFYKTLEEMFFLTKFTHVKDDSLESS